jgi:hypothetical protein
MTIFCGMGFLFCGYSEWIAFALEVEWGGGVGEPRARGGHDEGLDVWLMWVVRHVRFLGSRRSCDLCVWQGRDRGGFGARVE